MVTTVDNDVTTFNVRGVIYTATRQNEPFKNCGVALNKFDGLEFWVIEHDGHKRSVTLRRGDNVMNAITT